MAALTGVARTEHAIVGEVYAARHGRRLRAGSHHLRRAPLERRDGQVTDLVWHLRYDDEYLRTPSGWRIHGRALTINAIETRPVRRLRPHSIR